MNTQKVEISSLEEGGKYSARRKAVNIQKKKALQSSKKSTSIPEGQEEDSAIWIEEHIKTGIQEWIEKCIK